MFMFLIQSSCSQRCFRYINCDPRSRITSAVLRASDALETHLHAAPSWPEANPRAYKPNASLTALSALNILQSTPAVQRRTRLLINSEPSPSCLHHSSQRQQVHQSAHSRSLHRSSDTRSQPDLPAKQPVSAPEHRLLPAVRRALSGYPPERDLSIASAC